MCGISGYIDNTSTRDNSVDILKRMLATLRHRGPNDTGLWVDGPVAIGHKRLSILDLSSCGHQPMQSMSGRYILAFNGEIYNHFALRSEQEQRGWSFKGHSDTEVLLSLVEDFGLQQALSRCIGMFAIVLWDREIRKLQLARDRFGEKPIYYGWHGGCFLFGSELKALVEHPLFCREVDRESLAMLFSFGYVPSPWSIFRDISKLKPGSILSLELPPQQSGPLTPESCHQKIVQYWSAVDVAISGLSSPYIGGFDDAVIELESLLADAVQLQMQADVPVGAFLSGGVDSSAIVALMQAQSSCPIKTRTIGFENSKFDEARYARAIADYLGTDHADLYVTPRDALDVIPMLPSMYDEPLGDSSQIPTYLLAKLARQDVTVSLSGDGGDELFCGYPRYAYGNLYAGLPLRHSVLKVAADFSWGAIAGVLKRSCPSSLENLQLSRWALRHRLLVAKTYKETARHLSMIYYNPQHLVPGAEGVLTNDLVETPFRQEVNYLHVAMMMDKLTYLPDDVLLKVDRATMSVSLESRAPFLDHRITEFVARLPVNFLYDGHTMKRILRVILGRNLPLPLFDRPKSGFSIPLADWLREDLHEWSMDLLSSEAYSDILNMQKCRELYRFHCSGRQDLSLINWTILSFLAWAHQWLPRNAS